MGCSSSSARQAWQDQCQSPTRMGRSFSYKPHTLYKSPSVSYISPSFSYKLPIFYPAESKDDSYHMVALTSSTLGTLKLDPLDSNDANGSSVSDSDEPIAESVNEKSSRDFSSEVNQAKAWSEMTDHKIPKAPIMTPPNEPEAINAWELMAGLEDVSPLCSARFERASSFPTSREAKEEAGFESKQKNKHENRSSSPKPMWMQMSTGDSIITNFDPEIIQNFQRALGKVSPEQPIELQSKEPEKCDLRNETPTLDHNNQGHSTDFTGIVRARIIAFQQRIDAKKISPNTAKCYKCPPGGSKKVVFYCTSLRGVRRTHEDCCGARVILKGYGFRVDERDVSMHGGFRDELNEILGEGCRGSKLPKVFANGRYLGGAEEVRQMHESGELAKALEGCELLISGKDGVSNSCQGCGDVRFLPCETCSGSCKVYIEEDEEEDKEEEGIRTGGFRRCPDCNENGLVRCPICCCS